MISNMYKINYILCLVLFAINSSEAGRGNPRYGIGNGYGRGGMPQMPPTNPPLQTPKEYLDSNSGFSTFGIIAIIFAVIVFILAFYYGIMCYPFLCSNEKKYRFMDVSSTITATTSRSIQSIEHFPVDKNMN